jgi:hypothetical protein
MTKPNRDSIFQEETTYTGQHIDNIPIPKPLSNLGMYNIGMLTAAAWSAAPIVKNTAPTFMVGLRPASKR